MKLATERWLEAAETRLRGIIVAARAAHPEQGVLAGPSCGEKPACLFQCVVGTGDDCFRRLRLGVLKEIPRRGLRNAALMPRDWIELDLFQDGHWVLRTGGAERRIDQMSDERAGCTFLEALDTLLTASV